VPSARQIMQTRHSDGSVVTEEWTFGEPTKTPEPTIPEITMLTNAIDQAFADDGDNCAGRLLTTDEVKELKGNVLRSVSPIIKNMKYDIKEKNEWGKYWHDLAQERMSSLAASHSQLTQIKTDLAKLLAEKLKNL
jgi:hypothetical protein